MVTEKASDKARLHGKGVSETQKLKFLSYLGIRSDDLYFLTNLQFFPLCMFSGLA
jgi:hypothetical protein